MTAVFFLNSFWEEKKYQKLLMAFGAPNRKFSESEIDIKDRDYHNPFAERYPRYKKRVP